VDPLYVLKYTGPINGMLCVLGIWFFVRKATGSRGAALVAAVIYGCSGTLLTYEMIRHAGTNSQEFAMVFLLPTLWFLLSYFETRDKKELYTAFAGLCLMGLSHTLVFAAGVGLGVLALMVRFLMEPKRMLGAAGKTIIFGTLSGVIAVIPLGIGLLMGRSAHGSSLEYLVSTANIPFPAISWMMFAYLGTLGLMMLYVLFTKGGAKSRKRWGTLLLLQLFIGLFYLFGPYLTQSVALEIRKEVLLAPFLGTSAGFAIFVLSRPIARFDKREILTLLLSIGLFVGLQLYVKPVPFEPFKMERDASVEQYLRINETFRPSEWMIVSNEEGYAMVLGSGYHMFIKDFVEQYDPDAKVLARMIGGTMEKLRTPDVFIYYEKKIFRSNYQEMKEIYDRREVEKTALEKWIVQYEKVHGKLERYFEDGNMIVYRIHIDISQKENFDELWGN